MTSSSWTSKAGSGLRRSELLQKSIQVIETFDSKKTTVDAYVQDAPILKDKNIGEVELKFIHQVFYGCMRYQKFLKLFVTSFMYRSPTVAIRSEQTLYTVLAYLLFFRLEELGVAEFRSILCSGAGTDSALNALMQYAMSEEDLNKWVKMEWAKLYDVRFIEEEVIGKLNGFAAELRPVMDDLELKATGRITAVDGATVITKEKKITVSEPFNLTKVRPRLIPEPEAISREIKALPVPKNIAENKTTLATVQEDKRQRLDEHRAHAASKYEDNHRMHNTEAKNSASRPHVGGKEELAKQVEAERMAECTFRPSTPRAAPVHEVDAPVRHNVAAVLREDALLRKKQAAEYEELKRYEADLHDGAKFHEWQSKMKEQDALEEEARVHQRMVEMQLAREEAMEAQKFVERKNRIRAEHQRDEAKTQLAVVELEQRKELDQKQVLVQETIEDRELARRAEQDAQLARAKHAAALRKDKEAESERKAREDEQEMERRKDLIRQIRSLEKVPVERFKQFDAAEEPTTGLLEEMSLAELRERLVLEESKRVRELDEKRERQLTKKFDKQQELAEKAGYLQKLRSMAKDDAHARRDQIQQKKDETKARQDQYKEKCIEEAAAKIKAKKEQKRQEELRLKKELKEISIRRQFLAANADMVEAKAHGEQHAGLEREARLRQHNLLMDQKKQNDITFREKGIRRANMQSDADNFDQMKRAVNDRLDRARADDEALKDSIRKGSMAARGVQRRSEQRLRDEFGHTNNRFMQKLNARANSAGPKYSVSA